ncbi:hypothetical protein P262_01650 [Cronobacter malonaticus]|uniref:Ead/Ea22-like family protein n=1 Tax=Cronobacter malonaticus TaxID=413503 RepID=V5TX83_9ENTR|nr:hypothetical protein [Cronobacter malonaticus]AHB69532.1 hypothetical protein P262_01650 [Cronobacter malonaticus]
MNNDELIAAGHELAKCLDNEPLLDIAKLLSKMATQLDVTTAALREKTKQCEQLAAENSALKSSRAVLAENTFEACNAIASAGFSHEAIMRGLYESTGDGNKYPKPITTLVDEAMRKLETPATDAFLREVRAQGVEMFADFCRKKGDVRAYCFFNDAALNAEEFAAELRKGGAA